MVTKKGAAKVLRRRLVPINTVIYGQLTADATVEEISQYTVVWTSTVRSPESDPSAQ